jgi:iron(III) transport system substrate-binding protein
MRRSHPPASAVRPSGPTVTLFRVAPPFAAALLAAALLPGCDAPRPGVPPEESVTVPAGGKVIVYVEAPRYIAGPVLRLFQDETNVQVEAHYRSEIAEDFPTAVKREAAAGRADLLWGVSPLTALDLAADGLVLPFRPAGARPVLAQYRDRQYRWVGFAATPRVIIYNSDRVRKDEAPSSVEDLDAGPWSGKAAIAAIGRDAPAFHAAALFSLWGEKRAGAFFDRIASNGNRVVADDAAVRKLVRSGDALWGFVGLDEAICAKRAAETVNIMFPDRMGAGAVVVPHVMTLLARAPDPAQAKGLFAYMFTSEAAFQVGQNDCALITLLPDIPKPDWVPTLGVFNVTPVDNDAAFDIYRRHRAAFQSWGNAPAGAPER